MRELLAIDMFVSVWWKKEAKKNFPKEQYALGYVKKQETLHDNDATPQKGNEKCGKWSTDS